MSNYLPHYTKKRQTQSRKEETLRRLIKLGASEDKLIAAAEEVRAARIRTFRASLAKLPSGGRIVTVESAKIEFQIEVIMATSAHAILAEFYVNMTGRKP
jgi:hypothetical protein